MLETVIQILDKCNSAATNINPTILYNEGWMTRLLVVASIEAGIQLDGIDFSRIRHWYSEGLLSSPFLARSRGDALAEGFTHTDMALGDFHVDASRRGDIIVDGMQGTFGIIEAKMASRLSTGTKNAPSYDQANRNLACIAFNALSTAHSLFFAVVAPEKKIAQYRIKEQVDPKRMIEQISKRFDSYEGSRKLQELKERVLLRAHSCSCLVLSYESWLEALAGHPAQAELVAFKEHCYRFNRLAER